MEFWELFVHAFFSVAELDESSADTLSRYFGVHFDSIIDEANNGILKEASPGGCIITNCTKSRSSTVEYPYMYPWDKGIEYEIDLCKTHSKQYARHVQKLKDKFGEYSLAILYVAP